MSQIDICTSIIQTIKDYISSPENLKQHHEKKYFSRKRKLSLVQVILFLIYSSKASLNINISRIRDELPIDFSNVSKQAVSKAKKPECQVPLTQVQKEKEKEELGVRDIINWEKRTSKKNGKYIDAIQAKVSPSIQERCIQHDFVGRACL